MHTDPTLELLLQVTTALGNRMREFQKKTCAVFKTHELECEHAAWMQHQKRNMAMAKTKPNSQTHSSVRQLKEFNLKTYKLHALGHYCSTIQHFGTTDSYSTQPVSLDTVLELLDSNLLLIRVNVSIEPQKGGSFTLVAGQYHSSCQGSNSDSAASA